MRKILSSPLFYLTLVLGIFYSPLLLHGLVPTPADTIVGLYHPYRDFYTASYPRGIPFKNSLITDPVRQQYPWKFLTIDSLKQFSLPLWNPYSFSGTPLLANFQSGVFYPVNLVFFLLPFVPSWTLFILSQSIMAGVFMFFYLKHLRLNVYAQFLGSIVFIFCGFSIAWLEWGSILSTLLWLPLILLAKDHILEKRTGKWIMILLFAEISMIFAGHLQTLVYALVVSNLYLVARVYHLTEKYPKRLQAVVKMLWPFGLFLFFVLLVTSIQWLPTLRFIGESARSVDQLYGWQHDGWFIPWQHLIQFVIPDYFGNPATGNYWGVWNYGEFIGYIGIVPLMLCILAVCFRRDKKTYFFGSIVLLTLLFATPNPIAKLPYIVNLPFISSTQPTRLVALTDFALAILSAFGLDYFLKKKKYVVLPVILMGAVFVVVSIFTKVSPLKPSDTAVVINNSKLPLVLFIVAVAIFLALFLIKQKRVQTLLIILLLCLTVGDLLRFGQKFTPFTNPAYLYPQTSTLNFLQHHIGNYRLMSVDNREFASNFSVMYHLQSIDGYDPLYLRRYGELISASERGSPDISPPFGFNRIISPKRINSSIVDTLGVKYILSLSELSDAKLKKVFQEGDTRIYENKNVFPRAFFVNHLMRVSNKEEAIQPYFSSTFNLYQQGVVEDNEGIVTQTDFASRSIVVLTTYTPNLIRMHVIAKDMSFLVLTDMYYPTWHATLYNNTISQPLPIIRTDYTFRGMIIPKGAWTVEMKPSLF